MVGSASAKTWSGGMLWGLQSRVRSLDSNGPVTGWAASGAMSPRAQKPGVQALGWHASPESGSTSGGTGVGEGQVSTRLDVTALEVAADLSVRGRAPFVHAGALNQEGPRREHENPSRDARQHFLRSSSNELVRSHFDLRQVSVGRAT